MKLYLYFNLRSVKYRFFIERENGGHIISSLKYFLYSDDKMLVFSTKCKVSTFLIVRLLAPRLSKIKPMLCNKVRATICVGDVQQQVSRITLGLQPSFLLELVLGEVWEIFLMRIGVQFYWDGDKDLRRLQLVDSTYPEYQFDVGGLINISSPYLNSAEHEYECCEIEYYSKHS